MPEPLKDLLFNKNTIQPVAEELSRVVPSFDAKGFVREILKALPELELKARAEFIAEALRQRLPADYPSALQLILASLPVDTGWGKMSGFEDFRYMPYLTFVEKYGLEHPDLSLDTLHRLTKFFTAEGAIRPYLLKFYQPSMVRLIRWVKDDDWRVRRLVSEGTRPRLPWTPRLPMFIRNPEPVIGLLEQLTDDPNEIVRRSVANNLNDIAKDHPDLIAELAKNWSKKASKERLALLRHALRSLVKQGHSGALIALGYGAGEIKLSSLRLAPKKLPFGETLTFDATLINHGKAGRVVLDYAIHFVGSKKQLRRKVFKGGNVTFPAGGKYNLNRSHAIKPITTRKYYPGRHRLEIIANGKSLGFADFELLIAPLSER